MDLALSIILGLLHPTVAVLAHLERLLGARLEKLVLVLDVEWDALLGGAITQKASWYTYPRHVSARRLRPGVLLSRFDILGELQPHGVQLGQQRF